MCVCFFYLKEPETSEEMNQSEVAATAPRSVVEFAGSSPAPKRAREDSSLVPLIIPVSVPVRRLDSQDVGRERGEEGKLQRFLANDRGPSESKPSVIVTRRRSNRNFNTDMSAQVGRCLEYLGGGEPESSLSECSCPFLLCALSLWSFAY